MLQDYRHLDQATHSPKKYETVFLEKNEQVIINLLKEGDTLSIDQIQQATQIPLSGVPSTCLKFKVSFRSVLTELMRPSDQPFVSK